MFSFHFCIVLLSFCVLFCLIVLIFIFILILLVWSVKYLETSLVCSLNGAIQYFILFYFLYRHCGQWWARALWPIEIYRREQFWSVGMVLSRAVTSITSVIDFFPLSSSVDWFPLFVLHMFRVREKNMAAPASEVQIVPAKKPIGKYMKMFNTGGSDIYNSYEHVIQIPDFHVDET